MNAASRAMFAAGLLFGIIIALSLLGRIPQISGLTGAVVAEDGRAALPGAQDSTAAGPASDKPGPSAEPPQEPSEEQAFAALQRALQDIDEMERAGVGTSYVRDLHFEAQKAFEGENVTKLRARAVALQDADPRLAADLLRLLSSGEQKIGENYTFVIERTRMIRQTRDQSLSLLDELDVLEIEVSDFLNTTTGVNTTAVTDEYLAAREEFGDERFAAVEAHINATYLAMEDARAESSRVNAMLKASRRTVPYFVKTHALGLGITLVVLVLAGLIAWNESRRSSLAAQLRDLELEQAVAQQMLKDAQAEYYVTKRLSRSTFTAKVERIRDRQLNAKERRPLLEQDLVRITKRRRWYLLWGRA